MKKLNYRTVCALTIASGLISFGQTSYANGLLGKWEMTGQECQSGAPSKGLGEHFTGQVNAVALFTADQILASFKISYKLDTTYSDELIKQLEASLKTWDAIPDSEQKKKAIADINHSIEQLSKMGAGYLCGADIVRTYTVTGNKIHTEFVSSDSNCDGGSDSHDKDGTDSTFELVGDTLKVASDKPEINDNGQCPRGDQILTVFKRLK